ncbi:hypothetical protein K504DRAFT_497407 [Pleomassaria siparia CBS 279.74]|uniref:Uncharacterized protein n=1 Tax=Pleomassaria siparia CBS 279.74 TaxID=1314801 RepID=A0A6G1KRQ4_9PLEO|nr:hypothetical protein K504DRAFT_497407 [Pleomassaria siparia CBS 279.74]
MTPANEEGPYHNYYRNSNYEKQTPYNQNTDYENFRGASRHTQKHYPACHYAKMRELIPEEAKVANDISLQVIAVKWMQDLYQDNDFQDARSSQDLPSSGIRVKLTKIRLMRRHNGEINQELTSVLPEGVKPKSEWNALSRLEPLIISERDLKTDTLNELPNVFHAMLVEIE